MCDTFTCINCGLCCKMPRVWNQDIKLINEYLLTHPDIRRQMECRARHKYTCPFRNTKTQKCDIYEVRPVVCQIFGQCREEDEMSCPNNKTYGKLSARDIIKFDGSLRILNFIDWDNPFIPQPRELEEFEHYFSLEGQVDSNLYESIIQKCEGTIIGFTTTEAKKTINKAIKKFEQQHKVKLTIIERDNKIAVIPKLPK